MSQAFIICPESEKYIYVGLNLEWREVDGLELGEQSSDCPHCGAIHTWTRDDVVLRADGAGD